MTGVWATPDPIGILGGINFYAYVKNNPVKWVDPLGLYDDQDNNGDTEEFGSLGDYASDDGQDDTRSNPLAIIKGSDSIDFLLLMKIL